MKNYLYLIFFLIAIVSNDVNAANVHKIINLRLKLVEQVTNNPIELSVIEIFSEGKKVTTLRPDFDGNLIWTVCSKKISNHSITLKIYAANCETTEYSYTFNEDRQLTIALPLGKAPFNNNKELNEFIHEIGGYQCEVLVDDDETERLINAKYKHCDGRIKHFNDIPRKELGEWEIVKR